MGFADKINGCFHLKKHRNPAAASSSRRRYRTRGAAAIFAGEGVETERSSRVVFCSRSSDTRSIHSVGVPMLPTS